VYVIESAFKFLLFYVKFAEAYRRNIMKLSICFNRSDYDNGRARLWYL